MVLVQLPSTISVVAACVCWSLLESSFMDWSASRTFPIATGGRPGVNWILALYVSLSKFSNMEGCGYWKSEIYMVILHFFFSGTKKMCNSSTMTSGSWPESRWWKHINGFRWLKIQSLHMQSICISNMSHCRNKWMKWACLSSNDIRDIRWRKRWSCTYPIILGDDVKCLASLLYAIHPPIFQCINKSHRTNYYIWYIMYIYLN